MGSIFRQQYHVKDRHGRVQKRSSKKWYIAFKDAAGNWKREPAYEDKEASQHMLSRRMREVALETEGVFDHLAKAMARPIAEHIADFIQHMRDKGNTPSHCLAAETRLTKICTLGKINRSPELTKSRVDSALAALRDPRHDDETPISVATSNHYLGLAKHFAQWLVDEGRASSNALATMKKRDVAGNRTKERRPLTQAEFDKLLTATAAGPERVNLSGSDRAALYLLASFTGYRRRELSSVTPESFVFGAMPFLNVASGYSKRRKNDRIPLNATLAEFFRRYVADRPTGEPLWKLGRHTARMIQADMDAAGIEHRTGKIAVDFHSLRYGFTTGLARSGAMPKVAQQLARHSDINLTMNVYTKMENADERAAVERLPLPAFLTTALTNEVESRCKVRPRHARKSSVKKPPKTARVRGK